MRSLTYLFLIVLISCKGGNGKNSGNEFSQMTFSLDTVIIDPGDEVIFLKYGLLNSDISEDRTYLFNFNENEHAIEKINLDELRLEAKLPFEKEGPNGTGPSGGKMKVHSESQLTLHSMSSLALFALNGEKLKTIYLENFSLDAAQMHTGEYLRGDIVLDTVANRLYGITNKFDDNSYSLGILNLEKFEVTKLELKSFEKMSNFDIVYNSGGIIINYKEGINLDKFGTKVILSNSVTNALMWFDTERDSLFLNSYNSQLTANQKERSYKREHGTIEELEAEQRRLKQEINFLPPFWDENFQHFYRFSYEELPAIEGSDKEIKSNVYLTILDKDLNQIGETEVPQLTRAPGKHFAKDGKIWIYRNMADEMGFVRLTISGHDQAPALP